MVDFNQGFKKPEMIKLRPAIVLSPKIRSRPQLCTIVALSTTSPNKIMPYHTLITVPFELPQKLRPDMWVKGDMVNAVGFHRIDLLRLSKKRDGKREYQVTSLQEEQMQHVFRCVLHGMGLSRLTKCL